ncbi:hypothetical protein MJ561_19860 [Klebsiella pneumoniae]|nr:hypothetical protein MJ561_19860 [Klebsiella pneumoniae]
MSQDTEQQNPTATASNRDFTQHQDNKQGSVALAAKRVSPKNEMSCQFIYL